MYCNCRIGGIEKWYAEQLWHADMRIPPDLLRCVTFLGVKDSAGNVIYGGTACYISVPDEEEHQYFFGYLVTARHCVEKALRDYGELFIRVNLPSGDATLIALPNCWEFPENSESDIAVLPWTADSGVTELQAWSINSFATQEKITSRHIGIGDEVFSLGLFRQRHGTKQNLPILRAGVIASMPTEPIKDALSGNYFNAYLVELRSIGGLSGSPVFVYLANLGRPVLNARPSTGWEIFLLGIVRGHWEINQTIKGIDLEGDETSSINSGIALVSPIWEALEVLMRSDLTKERRKQSAECRKANTPVLDSGFVDAKKSEDEPFTKADFEAALKKVARKIAPEK